MSDEGGIRTRPSRLGRLRAAPTYEAVRAEFVERCGRAIFDWCRQRLQEGDAEDVTRSSPNWPCGCGRSATTRGGRSDAITLKYKDGKTIRSWLNPPAKKK